MDSPVGSVTEHTRQRAVDGTREGLKMYGYYRKVSLHLLTVLWDKYICFGLSNKVESENGFNRVKI
jgi:hypothetical protein